MDLRHAIAVVTGAASGIGKETVIELAKQGCTPALIDIQQDKLTAVLEEVRKYAPAAIAEVCDISNSNQVKQIVQMVHERYGKIDILINNAGMMIVKFFEETSPDEFDRQMAVNFYGGVNLIRAVLPIMEKQGKGVIINVASVGGRLVVPGTAVYAASKAAFQGFSEALHYELKDKGIHVGIILPGGTRTGVFDASTSKLGILYRNLCRTSPIKPARDIKKAIQKERFETIVPFYYKIPIEIHDFFPGLFSKGLLRGLRRYFK